MKSLITFLFLSILIISCDSEPKRDGYIIDGTAKGVYNGIRVYLKVMDSNGRQFDKDTAIVMNEKFTFKGKVTGPEMQYIYVNSVLGALPIIVENSEITVEINKDDLGDSKITGTKSNDGLFAFTKRMRELNEQQQQLNMSLREASQAQENEKVMSLQNDLANLNIEMSEYPFEFINSNLDNNFSLTLIESMLKNKNSDIDKILNAYNALKEDLKTSETGIRALAEIQSIQKILEGQASTNIGKIAPNFSAPNTEGKTIALNDIKGKVTIIDFWAAWCGPCRRENPNVVKVYKQFHDKGLEIIGVSLDGTPRQQDAKADWLKAIADDNLTWHHVSNLNYFNDPVAQMYNIQSIPATFILDAEGKIVAKNLRGPALEEKIAEMLN
jgi:peroxiredoxin/uncharacterized protein YdcH (DUF465 family)